MKIIFKTVINDDHVVIYFSFSLKQVSARDKCQSAFVDIAIQLQSEFLSGAEAFSNGVNRHLQDHIIHWTVELENIMHSMNENDQREETRLWKIIGKSVFNELAIRESNEVTEIMKKLRKSLNLAALGAEHFIGDGKKELQIVHNFAMPSFKMCYHTLSQAKMISEAFHIVAHNGQFQTIDDRFRYVNWNSDKSLTVQEILEFAIEVNNLEVLVAQHYFVHAMRTRLNGNWDELSNYIHKTVINLYSDDKFDASNSNSLMDSWLKRLHQARLKTPIFTKMIVQ